MPFLTSALLAGGLAAAGSIGGAALAGNAAGNAATTQAQASDLAALLQQSDANAALNFNEQQLNLAQQNTASTRAAGQNATIQLNNLMGLSPVTPQPINAGGNLAPQAGGPNGQGAYPGLINNPAPTGTPAPTPAPTAAPNPAPAQPSNWQNWNERPDGMVYPRAKGGATKIGLHYLVGERGPEELVMHPDGTGRVIPHVVSPRSELIHRADGGTVGLTLNSGPPVQVDHLGAPAHGSPGGLSRPPVPTSGTFDAGPFGTFDAGPFGAQQKNPLITGGSPNPVQNTPFTQWSQGFVPPTIQQAEQYPGYQFQLQQGEQALANQASATGELGDSNYGRALTNYAENAAQSDYGNVYNQALGQYQQAYNIFNNNQTNQFNRLAAIAGYGQTATGQLNQTGAYGANNAGNILTNSGAQVGQQLNNAAAATASGYIGQANAYGGALNNIGSNLGQYLTLSQIMNQGGGGGGGQFSPNSYGLSQS